MATNKAKAESRISSPEELKVRLRELKQEALNLRLQRATGQLENTSRIRIVRREIAQAMTAFTSSNA